MILDALAGSLNLSLLRYLSYAYTPPSLVACGHGLRQNLHVDQGGNGLLLSVLDCSLQLVKSLNGVGLAAICSNSNACCAHVISMRENSPPGVYR